MNKKIIYFFSLILLLASCDYNEKYFEGVTDGHIPTDLKKLEIDFEDYASLDDPVKTNGYFSEQNPAKDYLPDWLNEKYAAADAGSSAKVTFKFAQSSSDLYSKYDTLTGYTLAKADYQAVHGQGTYGEYLNNQTESKMYKALGNAMPDAEDGVKVLVAYNFNASSVPPVLSDPLLNYDFESLTPNEDLTSINNWFVSAVGNQWQVKSFDDNTYVSYSANRASEACEAWLVTPSLQINDDQQNVSFDVKIGYFNADCLSVLVSTDFSGDPAQATWNDITSQFSIPQQPTSGYGDFVNAGTVSLAQYSGQNVYVAFKYVGDPDDSKTTTYQIDNIFVGKDVPPVVETELRYAFYARENNRWNSINDEAVFFLTPADYQAMGEPGKNLNFSTSLSPDDYIPNYLKQQVKYPIVDQTKVVVYRFYDTSSKETSVKADEYLYDGTNWVNCTVKVVDVTEQYVLSEERTWNFDPSTKIILGAKGDAATSEFMQAIVDDVKTSKGEEYVSSYGNNEYYYGASAYQNNFDFRPAKWKEQAGDIYNSNTDEELTDLMFERLPEAFIPALKKLYSDAAPVSGVDVIYTVEFAIYTGATERYTIQYKVVGDAEFEYVDESITKIES